MTALAQALSVPPVDTRRKMSPGDKEKKKTGSATFFASEAASLSGTHTPFCAHTHPVRRFTPTLSPSLRQGMKKGLRTEVKKMGPLKVAHLNGLSVSRPPLHSDFKDEPERASNDERVRLHFLTGQTSEALMDGTRPFTAKPLVGPVCSSGRAEAGE